MAYFEQEQTHTHWHCFTFLSFFAYRDFVGATKSAAADRWSIIDKKCVQTHTHTGHREKNEQEKEAEKETQKSSRLLEPELNK